MKGAVKLLLAGMFCFSLSLAHANDIYITQSGDNLDLDITQDGQNNVIGNSTTDIDLSGDDMTLTMNQVGDNNIIKAVINGATYTGEIKLTGDSNTVDLDCDSSNAGYCDDVTMNVNVTGDSADITIDLGSTTDSSDFVGNIDITSAASETVTLTSNASSATTAADVDLDISNSTGLTGNTVTLTQSGAGDTLGHSMTVNHTGDGGVINVTQSGVNDAKVDLTTSGDDHTIDITQSD